MEANALECASLDWHDGVAVVTLARSEKLNAFNNDLHLALAQSLEEVATDPRSRAMILTGSGRAFSAGQDLAERAAAFAAGTVPDIQGSLEKLFNPLIRRIVDFPVPVIAAVNGLAFGAGAAIAIACDLALAGASAAFQFGFVNIGLGFDCGSSWTLPRLVGMQRAMDLALTGRRLMAAEAERIGLVARVIPDESLLADALALARQLAAASPSAVLAIRRQLRTGAVDSFEATLVSECTAQTALGRTDAYRDAVLRFSAPAKR